jgi:hypothetical protein
MTHKLHVLLGELNSNLPVSMPALQLASSPRDRSSCEDVLAGRGERSLELEFWTAGRIISSSSSESAMTVAMVFSGPTARGGDVDLEARILLAGTRLAIAAGVTRSRARVESSEIDVAPRPAKQST